MKISKKIVSLLTMTFLTVTLYGNTSNASTKETLTGSGRWETAIKISQNGWSKATNAVLVNDNSIADALSATPFAKLKDAPILLTESKKLDDRTKNELKRLGVKNVFLIGGLNTLSTNIENQLNKENITYERVSGNDRYETSLKLAEKLDKEKTISHIVVVNGEKGLADAVSVGAIAAQDNMPIVLSSPSNGTKTADDFIKGKNIKTSYIIGGTYSISNYVEQNLPNSKRISGSNRNETNAKVIQEFYKKTDLKNIYVTKDGVKKESDLIDSLSVGVLAAKNNSPILLVGSNIDSSQKDILNTKIFDKVTKVGGLGNEGSVEEILDMQEETTYTVKTVEELNVALKKSDANDTIKFKPEKRIADSFEIETKKAITIDFSGEYTQSITLNIPNGEVNNTGDITGDIILKNIKDGTLINKGRINGIDIYDNDGSRIENEDNGEIWLITILSDAKDVYIKNDGDITKISNNSQSTNIKNTGRINTVSGSKEPVISGNRPKVNDTDKDDNSNLAVGLYPKVEACYPNLSNYVLLTVPQTPRNSNYKIYYRVKSTKPLAMKVDTKIDLSDWKIVNGTSAFDVKAKNGSYIEVVEVSSSSKRVSRWGRTSETDDGTKVQEVAKGLNAIISSINSEDVQLITTKVNSGCKLYYRISQNKPTAMNVGDIIELSSWSNVIDNSINLKSSNIDGKYIELVELNSTTNMVTRWGVTTKISVPDTSI
ncbi:cell wall-binding repeat-containing protein [Clostridioides difficile]|nr:cell wall-binding repeat-containing protein [Clostridioides difficile]MDM9942983.1 cell wall-binding repeat-containing protein [Clostridioides difficile]